jgi:hypothetical protein
MPPRGGGYGALGISCLAREQRDCADRAMAGILPAAQREAIRLIRLQITSSGVGGQRDVGRGIESGRSSRIEEPAQAAVGSE